MHIVKGKDMFNFVQFVQYMFNATGGCASLPFIQEQWKILRRSASEGIQAFGPDAHDATILWWERNK